MKKGIVLLTLIICFMALYVSNALEAVSGAQPVLCAADMGAMTQQELSENVLRLHIRANSNNSVDQNVKLQVRDAVTAAYADIFAGMGSLEDAAAYVTEHEADMRRMIDDYLKDAGMSYTCDVELERCVFPQKTYGELTFPAGEYLAVNILLGSGGGDNWWCVLFPPLCFLNTREDASLPQNEIRLKSRIADLFESWFKK